MYKIELFFYVENMSDIKPALERVVNEADEFPSSEYFHKRFRTAEGDRLLVTGYQIEKNKVEEDIEKVTTVNNWLSPLASNACKVRTLNN